MRGAAGLVLTTTQLIACAADPVRLVPPTLTPNRACSAQTVVDERQAAHALGLLLDDWHDAAAKSDETRYFAHLAADSIFLGTDATERWSKDAFQAYAHPHFSAGRGWEMKAARRNIVVEPAGQLAYFDEELETRSLGPARGSGVLVLRDGVWKILQYNLAITVPNERFAQVRDAIALAVPGAAATGETSDASRLLSGSWVGTEADGSAIEEHWTADAKGALLGMGRSKGGAFFEYLRVENRPGGKLVYVAQPMGKAATEFVMQTPAVAGTLVFENLKHDYPKRISYQEKDGSLLVSIEGDAKQPKQSWVLKRTLLLPARSKR